MAAFQPIKFGYKINYEQLQITKCEWHCLCALVLWAPRPVNQIGIYQVFSF